MALMGDIMRSSYRVIRCLYFISLRDAFATPAVISGISASMSLSFLRCLSIAPAWLHHADFQSRIAEDFLKHDIARFLARRCAARRYGPQPEYFARISRPRPRSPPGFGQYWSPYILPRIYVYGQGFLAQRASQCPCFEHSHFLLSGFAFPKVSPSHERHHYAAARTAKEGVIPTVLSSCALQRE